MFVTHFLDQVYEVTDRITVLRNGKFVGTRETAELPQIELVKMMLGRELESNALQRAGRTLLSEKPVAAFQDYGKKGVIAPFSLEVRPGEIVGLAGLLGSGRTETAEVIFGIHPADSGTASVKGKPVALRSPQQASRLGIGFCPEDRKTDGIIGAASVRENIILALQAQRGWLRPIPRREQDEIAARFIRQLGIRTPGPEQPIEFLSGGNQQKVLLSRWLLTKPQFLILDEPTRGIDVEAVNPPLLGARFRWRSAPAKSSASRACSAPGAPKPPKLSSASTRRTAARRASKANRSRCARRSRPHGWGSASARKTGKPTGSSGLRRCVKTSFWRFRPSAAGCARSRGANRMR
ncbi:Putative sugar ABC transport system, ATP-binding protein YtfR [Cronobacter dublinensis 582]|nr:Putative sugar ABC transport system, ATP-binding protein YtfR [Cronobacter dublinensis 582]